MPAGMHPWMDPERETRLWPHEYGEVYRAFDRIFGCQGHGWANLQSAHLNLPFANDDEFAKLHAAIRLVLPILPALSASSPVVEGQVTGLLDNRLEVYRTNSRKIVRAAGKVIPEAVFESGRLPGSWDSRTALRRDRPARSRAGLAARMAERARCNCPLFARGDRDSRSRRAGMPFGGSCPLCDDRRSVLLKSPRRRAILAHPWASPARPVAVEPLASIFLTTIRSGDEALIYDDEYLKLFDYPGEECTVGELWRHLLTALPEVSNEESPWREPLETILNEGPLARRIVDALPDNDLEAVYEELCRCLADGYMRCFTRMGRRRSSRRSLCATTFPGRAWGTRSYFRSEGLPRNALPCRLRLPSITLPPIRNNVDQSLRSGVIPRTGIPPMHGFVDITTADRIVMDVLDLLPHHLVAGDLLRMASLRP